MPRIKSQSRVPRANRSSRSLSPTDFACCDSQTPPFSSFLGSDRISKASFVPGTSSSSDLFSSENIWTRAVPSRPFHLLRFLEGNLAPRPEAVSFALMSEGNVALPVASARSQDIFPELSKRHFQQLGTVRHGAARFGVSR